MNADKISGAGLGLRRSMADDVLTLSGTVPDFFELTPENWMQMGGRYARQLRAVAERFPLVCHGLSLSLGGPDDLDTKFVADLKTFLDQNRVLLFSEHLSYCSDHAQLYDLMPLPFTEEAVHHVAARIRQVQEILQRRIAIENVSYYASLSPELSEAEFINAVLSEADCDLLLDVNNVYVNSVNHRYDPRVFIASLPASRIAYLHIAGHYRESESLIVDTHGADVISDVWNLLDYTYRTHGVSPTLLERDFNLPPLGELLSEVDSIRHIQHNLEASYALRQSA